MLLSSTPTRKLRLRHNSGDGELVTIFSAKILPFLGNRHRADDGRRLDD